MPTTIGEHLRKKRLELGLLQKEVAESLGASPFTVGNWESGATGPATRAWPRVIAFLGYDPVGSGDTIAAHLLALRRRLGLTQRELAHELRVDPGTLSRWELGVRLPTGKHLIRVEEAIRR